MYGRRLLVSSLLGAAWVTPLAAQAQSPLLVDGTFEMVMTLPALPGESFRDVCTLSGTVVRCVMHKQMGAVTYDSTVAGTLRGDRLHAKAEVRVTFGGPCSFISTVDLSGTIVLAADGTLTTTWTGGPVTYSGFVGDCAGMPRSSPPSPPEQWTGVWRQLTTGAVPAVEAAPAGESPKHVVLLDKDGKRVTIDLAALQAGTLTVEGMALAKRFELKPPSGGETYTLQAWHYPGLQGGDAPMFVPMQRLDVTSIWAAESAAAWVKANPGKASLAALGLAVSIAMPYTATFQASAAGMTFLESAGIGFMTAATPAAVQTLVTSAAAGEGFWKSSGKAVRSGTIAGAESLIGTTVGAGVTGAVETGAALTRRLVGTGISEEAVKGFGAVASGMAGSVTDLGVGILHDRASEAIADSAGRTTIPDVVPPVRPTRAGGIVLPILQRPDAAR